MLAVLVPSVASLAVTVQVPTVLLVRLSNLVPEDSAAFAGKVAFGSVEATEMTSATEVTRFQFASTALTVTL